VRYREIRERYKEIRIKDPLENHEGFREIQEIHGNPEWETHRSSMDYRKIWNGRYEKLEGNLRKILRDSREIYGGQGQICIKKFRGIRENPC
jgi:hypothetical protein